MDFVVEKAEYEKMEKESNQAWKMLLDSLEHKDKQILELKKREIELLQKLMQTEENVKGLIQVIGKKLYEKKPVKKEEKPEDSKDE